MTKYQGIHGRPIRALSSDLSGAAAEGEVWYNTDSNLLRVMYPFTGWTTVDTMVQARTGMSGCGIVTAGLAVGGVSGTIGVTSATYSEEYDGTSWAAGGTLTQAREQSGAFGTQAAGAVCGGRINDGNPGPTYSTNKTEEYNGSSWTAGGNYPLIVLTESTTGTLTAGLGGAGSTTPADPSVDTNVSAEYDGTSWAAGNPVVTARRDTCVGPQGTQTAGLCIDGRAGTTHSTATEEYDGTCWATAGSTPATIRAGLCFGTLTACLAGYGHQGGQGTVVAACTTYDGTSWSAAPTGGTARYFVAGVGASSSSGLACGGTYLPGWVQPGATEEFSSTGTVVKTITTS